MDFVKPNFMSRHACLDIKSREFMLSSLKKFVLVALACVERLGQRPELDFKLPAGGSVPVLFSSLVSCKVNTISEVSKYNKLFILNATEAYNLRFHVSFCLHRNLNRKTFYCISLFNSLSLLTGIARRSNVVNLDPLYN